MTQTILQLDKQTEEIDHYLFLLQDLIWKILQDADETSSLKKRFGQLFKEGYPEGLQLPKAYLALISHLLQLNPLPIQPEQFPNGTALLDTQGWCRSREIPEPIELAQLGALWMILGVRLKNEALQRAGLKIAIWQIHLLDGAGMPHVSLWSRASSFRSSTLALWNHALFTLAYRLTGEKVFFHLSEIARQEAWDPNAFPVSLLVLVPSTMTPSVPNVFHPFTEEITVGMMKFSNAEMSFMAHLSGWNSGLFSFHKKGVAIVNAGPQVGDGDDLSRFGICRTWGVKQRPFQEITWEKTAYHCHLKGWTQLKALPLWMQLDARLQAGQVFLEVALQDKAVAEPLSMALFLKCDKLILGGKHYLEIGSLEGYEGRSLTLELQGPSEKIAIHPDPSLKMKVTPLAGGQHFWGAQFLVSFPLETSLFKIEVK
ncbi:MAG: hypothetical protein KBA81_07210 [Rhabdochlamydiaceae bacterium]|nr:hypothetical protein [Rhabdochlamydiaceae bacterium]